MDDKDFVDKFLDVYDKHANKKVEYRRIIVKPSRIKSIFGFVFSLIFFILILTLFSFNLVYFILLIGSLLVCLYYGINLFTKKGIGIPRVIEVPVSDDVEDEQ